MIYNPNSGHTMNEENLKTAKNILPQYGYNVKIIPTKYTVRSVRKFSRRSP